MRLEQRPRPQERARQGLRRAPLAGAAGGALDRHEPGRQRPAARGAPPHLPGQLGVLPRRDRPLLLHRPRRDRRVPGAVLRAVRGAGRLPGLLRAAGRRGGVGRLRLRARPQPRRARRPARAPGAPLGRARLRRGAHHPSDPHVRHGRLPPAEAHQLADRPRPPVPRRLQRPDGLLAAGRPALRDRPAHLLRHHRVDPVPRPHHGLVPVRRRVPDLRHHRAHLPGAHLPPAGGASPGCSGRTSACSGCSATRSSRGRGGATRPSSARRWSRPTPCAPPATSFSAPAC